MKRSSKKSRVAKSRKRGPKGHFLKTAHEPARKAKRSAKRTAKKRSYKKPNPWKGQPIRHKRAALKGIARRKRRLAAARRAREASKIASLAPRRTRRKSAKRKASPRRAAVRHTTTKRCAPRRTSRKALEKAYASGRRSGLAAKHKTKKRTTTRKRPTHRVPELATRSHHSEAQLQSMYGEGYALENPLSNGELMLVIGAGGLYFGLTDMVSRYIETTSTTAATQPTVANNVITAAFPSGMALGAQAAMAILPGIGQAFVQEPWMKASLQAATLGAGLHIAGDLFKGLIAKFMPTNATVMRLYGAEIAAQQAVTATAPAATGNAGLMGVGTLAPNNWSNGRPSTRQVPTFQRPQQQLAPRPMPTFSQAPGKPMPIFGKAPAPVQPSPAPVQPTIAHPNFSSTHGDSDDAARRGLPPMAGSQGMPSGGCLPCTSSPQLISNTLDSFERYTSGSTGSGLGGLPVLFPED